MGRELSSLQAGDRAGAAPSISPDRPGRRPEAPVPPPASPARIVRTPAELAGLADAWNALAEQSGSPMQRAEWAVACSESFCRRGDRLEVVVMGPAGRPTAIAPLVRRRGSGRLELLGGRELYEPADFLAADRPALTALAVALARSNRPLCLHRIPADSPTVAALEEAYQGRGLLLRRPVAGSPSIPLDPSWADPLAKLKAHAGNYRRGRRRAETMGSVGFEMLSPSPEELPALLEEIFRVEAAGWKGRSGTALAVDPIRGPFFRRYAKEAARAGLLRVHRMLLGDRTIAVQMGAEWGGAFWMFKSGYDEEFQKVSPGILLMLHSIADLAGRGLRSFEVLGVMEPAKRLWDPVERPCVTVRTYPIGPRGLALLGADGVRLGLSRMRKRWERRGVAS